MNGDQNPNRPGQGPGQPFGGGGEPKEPEQKFGAPLQKEVNIRSMESDKKSVEGGEQSPVPESVMPPEDVKEPVFRPETQASETLELGGEEEQPKPKKGLVWAVVGVVVIAAALIIYFFVIPAGPAPSPEPPPPVGAPPPSPISHNSLFLTGPEASSAISISSLLLTSITNALQALAADKLANGEMREIGIFDTRGNQIPFSSFLAAFIPAPTINQLASWFEDDFTAFIYYDESGAWPGYVAQIKNGVNINEVKINLRAMETSDISKFYLSPPGTFGGFKDGAVNNKKARYSVGSQKGAAFSYTYLDNLILISTNYEGAKKAATLLGFK